MRDALGRDTEWWMPGYEVWVKGDKIRYLPILTKGNNRRERVKNTTKDNRWAENFSDVWQKKFYRSKKRALKAAERGAGKKNVTWRRVDSSTLPG